MSRDLEKRLAVRQRDSLYALNRVVSGIVDIVAHGNRLHRRRGEGITKLANALWPSPRQQPRISLLTIQYDRHAIVDGFDQRVSNGCQNGKGLEHVSIRTTPAVPETRKPKRSTLVEAEQVGLLTPGTLLPLVKAVRRHQTTTAGDALTKRRFLTHRFHSGINHPMASRGLLQPRWNQAPLHVRQAP